MFLLVQTFNIELFCNGSKIIQSPEKNASIKYYQQCANQKMKCVNFKYNDIDDNLRNYLQMVTTTQTYNLCAQFDNKEMCRSYCPQTCRIQIEKKSIFHFNASIKQNNPVNVDIEYVNRTVTTNTIYYCQDGYNQYAWFYLGISLTFFILVVFWAGVCIYSFNVYEKNKKLNKIISNIKQINLNEGTM